MRFSIRWLRSYVPQSEGIDCDFPVSVWDVVMMGRYGAMNFLRIPRGSLMVLKSLKPLSQVRVFWRAIQQSRTMSSIEVRGRL